MDRSTINTAEAARRAGVSGDTIRRWARLGYLTPIRVGVGRRYRIDEAELAAVIDGSVPATTQMPQGPVFPDPARDGSARRGHQGTAS